MRRRYPICSEPLALPRYRSRCSRLRRGRGARVASRSPAARRLNPTQPAPSALRWSALRTPRLPLGLARYAAGAVYDSPPTTVPYEDERPGLATADAGMYAEPPADTIPTILDPMLLSLLRRSRDMATAYNAAACGGREWPPADASSPPMTSARGSAACRYSPPPLLAGAGRSLASGMSRLLCALPGHPWRRGPGAAAVDADWALAQSHRAELDVSSGASRATANAPSRPHSPDGPARTPARRREWPNRVGPGAALTSTARRRPESFPRSRLTATEGQQVRAGP